MANNQELVDEIFYNMNKIVDLLKEMFSLLEEIEVCRLDVIPRSV